LKNGILLNKAENKLLFISFYFELKTKKYLEANKKKQNGRAKKTKTKKEACFKNKLPIQFNLTPVVLDFNF
jgi:hypothetical protein